MSGNRQSGTNSIRSDLKIIVIGSSGAGKTSFVNKWTKNIFQEAYKATIVSEFGFKVFDHEGKLYRIQIWDLGGQDKTSTITKIFAKDSHGCVIVADANKDGNLEE
jgi:small GTP-binding protein